MPRRHGTLEQRRAQAKRWRERNVEKKRADNAAWRAAHPGYKCGMESVRRYNAVYRKDHPDLYRAHKHRRRARIVGAGGLHAVQEWLEKCALLGNVCFYCGEARPLTVDHKIPIARGGADNIENIVPSCARCNSRKNIKTAREFMRAA